MMLCVILLLLLYSSIVFSSLTKEFLQTLFATLTGSDREVMAMLEVLES